ncbi:52 kDa repressor of the inhibitor of the protein kinase-like isoform X2 [Betta splendens]|uniref:52 kDa repressor of the inhibitor of the protein kinase-like isoform X2 n=1 Tax=Betta splendens TaxID=158456 RepID=A0A9W2Y8N7_BETSP|nr:52 kDa repressor of the inhibitor of the protein kinase-like isoform X2 [Betta splendens]
MQNHCAVPSCSSSKFDPQPLFRFPRDPERSKKWVEKCQRKDLADKSPDQLYRFYRVCGKHFDTSLIDSTKDNETERKGRKKMKKSQEDTVKEDVQTLSEEDENKEFLKSLFEVLLLLGEQSIPPITYGDSKWDTQGLGNFQALLEYRMNCGDGNLKKRYEVNKQCCSSAQLIHLLEVCEKFIRSKLVEEVKHNGFFSLLTDDLVKISEEWYLPVFIRFVDQSNCQRERFFGFLNLEEDEDVLAEKLLSEITESWGLDMEQCRGQAHSCSGTRFSKVKTFAAALLKRYPMAVLTLRSTRTLNIVLAGGMALSGVQLVMSTFMKIESFFSQSPFLQLELEHAISIFYPNKEEKANKLKEICRTNWTRRHDAFNVAMEVLEALLLCVDSVHDNEDMRWTDQVTHNALEISKALTDFEFIMALVVLKNVTALTQAFGQNVQGKATDIHFAAASLKAVLHSLKEVSENIDVYHEFWNDEAVNLAAAMEIPVKVPRSILRKHQSEYRNIRPEHYYKNHLSVLVVDYIIKELNELFCEEHVKTLRCLTLVPTVIEQNKSTEPEEDSIQVFKNDIPTVATLSAELHCWWVKWSKKGKGETFPSSLHETLQLPDVKFFPNMLAILRLIGIMPTLSLEDSCNVAYKRFKMYIEDIPLKFKSKSLAVINLNYDVGCDLDSVVEMYMKTNPEEAEEL